MERKRGPKRPRRAEKVAARQEGVKKTAPTIELLASKHTLSVVAIAVLIGVINSSYLNHLFENERFFSHLSPLERELSFPTELGLYYSYYKTLVESDSFFNGMGQLLQDNVTEYPSTFNTLKRFNLYPEVVLGGLYRFLSSALSCFGVSGKTCYTIKRGYGQPPVESCVGIAEPHYFYVYGVFSLNFIQPASTFLLSVYLSDSVLGGIVTTLMFAYNHGEATRVMWSPPLRESFAMPFLALQLLCLTWVLRSKKLTTYQCCLLCIVTVLFMLPWQFAQFTLLTQVFALLTIYSMRMISGEHFLAIIYCLGCGLLVNVLIQFGNLLLLTSYFASLLVVCVAIVKLQKVFDRLKIKLVTLAAEIFLALCGTVALKIIVAKIFRVQDDAHIGAILLSKFTSYQDFHTQMYTCAAEFDFIALEYFINVTTTLLLPVAGIVAAIVTIKVLLFVLIRGNTDDDSALRNNDSASKSQSKHHPVQIPEAAIVYHVLQCMAFGSMAVMIMRLKLFFTPQMCILSGLIACRKVTQILTLKQQRYLAVAVIMLSSVSGLWNMRHEMNIIGEFNKPEMEEMVLWINESTPSDAVFAGAMPTMATVKLCTGRPIINHPHYEDAIIREKTKLTYLVYSRKTPQYIHTTLSGLGANYVIVEDVWCNKQYRPGCAYYEVYDKEFPEDQEHDVFCKTLSKQVPEPFQQAFINKYYRILRVS